MASKAVLYVPASYNPQSPHGVVVWLHASGGDAREELLKRFRPLCEERSLILLAPQAENPRQWQPQEVDFASKALEAVLAKYAVDRTRIVAHGYQAGGAMSYLLWNKSQELVTGVAAIDGPMPRGFSIPDNDPMHHLALFTGLAEKSRFAQRIQQGIEAVEAKKYAVTQIPLGEKSRYLNQEELKSFARWIDSLDRF